MTIFDGHNDTLIRIPPGVPDAFITGMPQQHMDLPRCQQAGFAGGLFAIYTASKAGVSLDHQQAEAYTHEVLDLAHQLIDQCDAIAHVRDVAELDAAVAANQLAMILHIEGAEAIAPDLSNLDTWYERGVRSLGLVWSRTCAFGQGIGPADTGEGLTDAGKALVRACNDKRILVDVSHLNDAGFDDVASISNAPLVASHSNVRALCQFPRNLTDQQIDAVAASGGIIGMNFCTAFLIDDGTPDTTSISDIADHACYIADRVGVQHVGLGSDFDGCPLPGDMVDVTGLPRLLDELQRRGWSGDDVEAFAFGNWRRVLAAIWA